MALCAALLQGQKLLGTECLVVDLRCGLNEILEVGSEEEVSQVDEFAVVLVLDVDNAPPVLATANLFAVHDDRLLRSDNSEGDEALLYVSASWCPWRGWLRLPRNTHLDLAVDDSLLLVELVVVVRVHLQVVEGKLFLDALLECLLLLEGERVGLGNDGNNIDDVGQLLEDDNIDRLEGVARGLDEEQAAVDPGVLDVALPLSREFLTQVSRVLILDVFHNGIPATVVVDKVAIAGGVDDVEPQADTVLLDDV